MILGKKAIFVKNRHFGSKNADTFNAPNHQQCTTMLQKRHFRSKIVINLPMIDM